MILCGDQRWAAAGSSANASRYIVLDDTDSSKDGASRSARRDRGQGAHIQPLVSSLHGDPSHISLLGGNDLELLSDMDPESLADIVPDRWDSRKDFRNNEKEKRKDLKIIGNINPQAILGAAQRSFGKIFGRETSGPRVNGVTSDVRERSWDGASVGHVGGRHPHTG